MKKEDSKRTTRAGRPKILDDKEKRKNTRLIYLNDEELKNILFLSDKAKMKLSEFVRNSCLNVKFQILDENSVILEQEKIRLLSKIGNNINQIAHFSHSKGLVTLQMGLKLIEIVNSIVTKEEVDAIDLNEFQKEVDEIRDWYSRKNAIIYAIRDLCERNQTNPNLGKEIALVLNRILRGDELSQIHTISMEDKDNETLNNRLDEKKYEELSEKFKKYKLNTLYLYRFFMKKYFVDYYYLQNDFKDFFGTETFKDMKLFLDELESNSKKIDKYENTLT